MQEYAKTACSKVLSCGHLCGGVKDEDPCLPCLHRCRTGDQEQLKQDADDMCMICFTEALSAAPAILVGILINVNMCTLMMLRFWMHTMQTQIRLLLEKQSDQGLHYLQSPLHSFRRITANLQVSEN